MTRYEDAKVIEDDETWLALRPGSVVCGLAQRRTLDRIVDGHWMVKNQYIPEGMQLFNPSEKPGRRWRLLSEPPEEPNEGNS